MFRKIPIITRIAFIFSVSILFAMAISVFSLYELQLLATRGVNIAVKEQATLETILDIRERLASVYLRPTIDEESLNRFIKKISIITKDVERTPIEDETFREIQVTVQNLRIKKEIPTLSERVAKYRSHLASIDTILEIKLSQVYRAVHNLRAEQEKTAFWAIVIVSIFLGLLAYITYRVLRHVINPLIDLSRYVETIKEKSHLNLTLFANNKSAFNGSHNAAELLRVLKLYEDVNLKRLLIEKRRADIIASAMSDGIILLCNNELLYSNSVALRILGLTPEKATRLKFGKEARGRLDSDSPGIKAVSDAISKRASVEFSIEMEDKRRFYYLLQVCPVVEDFIEKFESEALKDATDVYREYCHADTIIVAKDITILKESQEAKAHFIATLAHEVKTPITSLTMATKLLAKSVSQFNNPTHRTLVQTCAGDVDRLRILIDQLLSASSFDMVSEQLRVESCDVIRVVKKSLQFFLPQAFQKGVEVHFVTPDVSQKIYANMDVHKITWALSILFTNAIRHTPKSGKVDVFVGQNQGFAEIRICDTGPSIEKEWQDRLFDRFNVYYDIRVSRTGSIGMGLYIAREIALAHQGSLTVLSEHGNGVEFKLTLPVANEVTNVSEGGNSGSSSSGR